MYNKILNNKGRWSFELFITAIKLQDHINCHHEFVGDMREGASVFDKHMSSSTLKKQYDQILNVQMNKANECS